MGSFRRVSCQSNSPEARSDRNDWAACRATRAALMLFEANKKTALVAYILWFFLRLFGGHNFYLKRTGVASRAADSDAHHRRGGDHDRLGPDRCIPDPRLGTKSEQPARRAARRVVQAGR